MYISLFIIILIPTTLFIFIRQPKFGKLPTGERLEKIKRSPNYKNGAFQKQSKTPDLTEGATYFSVMKTYFFGQNKRVAPKDTIPSIKPNLLQLNIKQNI